MTHTPNARAPSGAAGKFAHRLARLGCMLLVLAGPAARGAVVLAPQYGGPFAAGTGADAAFYRIANDWHGSSVLWNEAQGQFGSGAPIGSFSWGTGLWGEADWRTVQESARGAGGANAPALVQSWTGSLDTINYGNSRYNECYAQSWGSARLLPFFAPAPDLGDCDNPAAGEPSQQNWTAHVSGYIGISQAGEYNFSVLHDDGFFFRLIGAGGAERDIGRDYLNPRDRLGFDENLALSEGLYGFELGAWNRLGAGVVDLRWAVGCKQECEWSLVPVEHLVATNAIPAPGSLALVIGALAALAGSRALRRRRAA